VLSSQPRADEIAATMLSWPYAHLLINHFPVVMSVSALGVAILALVFRRRELWLTAMAALTVAGAFVYPVHFTGLEADKALGDSWYIRAGAIKSHEDAGTIAMYVILVVGAFAAYSWWRSLKRPAEEMPAWMRAGVVAGALAAVTMVTYTAYLGGKIIHESPVLQLTQPPPGLPAGIAADSVARAGH
jgi:uncharacterized membrane protein